LRLGKIKSNRLERGLWRSFIRRAYLPNRKQAPETVDDDYNDDDDNNDTYILI